MELSQIAQKIEFSHKSLWIGISVSDAQVIHGFGIFGHKKYPVADGQSSGDFQGN
jgi:hypothetical protein